MPNLPETTVHVDQKFDFYILTPVTLESMLNQSLSFGAHMSDAPCGSF